MIGQRLGRPPERVATRPRRRAPCARSTTRRTPDEAFVDLRPAGTAVDERPRPGRCGLETPPPSSIHEVRDRLGDGDVASRVVIDLAVG
jgi:hypothetical protein